MKLEEAKALFLLAGFEVKNFHQIENQYWPDAYVELRKENPWWLVETTFGLIKIGWRKRVISISWESLPFRGVITDDSVTKDDTMVHAYSLSTALLYLTNLRFASQAMV